MAVALQKQLLDPRTARALAQLTLSAATVRQKPFGSSKKAVIHRVMTMNVLAVAAALTDRALLARVQVLAVKERDATVELVAHLAELDTRKAIYAAEGYGSLFAYCTEALGLSDDAAYNRIEAARACRRFPVILDLLADGAVTLTSVRMLARYLTADNHQAVLAEARGKSKRKVEELVARLAPRPDVVASVRKLPIATPAAPTAGPMAASETTSLPLAPSVGSVTLPTPRPVVQATAPDRYRVQFTVDRETHDRLRHLQDLLRREIPDGDPGAIVARALIALQEKVEKAKLAATAKPRRRTRSGTGPIVKVGGRPPRAIPAEVKRIVYRRDGGRCAFVAASGKRCTERSFLEFHHVWSYAKGGPPTVENTSLRCGLCRYRHSQHYAESRIMPCRTGRHPLPLDSAAVSANGLLIESA